MQPSAYHSPQRTGQPYNRIVSQPEPGVMLIEPFLHTTDEAGVVLPTVSSNPDLMAIADRYCAVTGIGRASLTQITYDGLHQRFVIRFNPTRSGNGVCLGNCAEIVGGCVADKFTMSMLSGAEYMNGITVEG